MLSDMLKLNIAQQYTRLELDITQPAIALNSTLPKIELSSQAAVVEISQTPGELRIDNYPCRRALGFKKPADVVADAADNGRQTALATIGRIAEDGNRLAAIETGENAIATIAAESMIEEMPDLVIAYIPLPDISYQPGKVEYHPIPSRLDLKVQRGQVDLELQRGRVEGYIAQRNSVRFWTTEGRYERLA